MQNKTVKEILISALMAFVALFINGFGVYLLIHSDIGAHPWDLLNLGIARITGISYGNASIAVSLIILLTDVLLNEKIGLAMFIDAFTVGKAVDLFNYLDLLPEPSNLAISLLMMTAGLFVTGFTQALYMWASLGCGPRDSLMVGLSRRFKKIPISFVSIALLSFATLSGFLLGAKVGIGTLYSAFLCGPIMHLCFRIVHFDATSIRHQDLLESLKIILIKKELPD